MSKINCSTCIHAIEVPEDEKTYCVQGYCASVIYHRMFRDYAPVAEKVCDRYRPTLASKILDACAEQQGEEIIVPLIPPKVFMPPATFD